MAISTPAPEPATSQRERPSEVNSGSWWLPRTRSSSAGSGPPQATMATHSAGDGSASDRARLHEGGAVPARQRRAVDDRVVVQDRAERAQRDVAEHHARQRFQQAARGVLRRAGRADGRLPATRPAPVPRRRSRSAPGRSSAPRSPRRSARGARGRGRRAWPRRRPARRAGACASVRSVHKPPKTLRCRPAPGKRACSARKYSPKPVRLVRGSSTSPPCGRTATKGSSAASTGVVERDAEAAAAVAEPGRGQVRARQLRRRLADDAAVQHGLHDHGAPPVRVEDPPRSALDIEAVDRSTEAHAANPSRSAAGVARKKKPAVEALGRPRRLAERRRRGHRRPQRGEALRLGGEAFEQRGERVRAAGAEVEAVEPVAHLLRHAADVGADDGPAVEQRLLDDQGRVLPPDGGDDHRVRRAHHLVHARVLVGAAVAEVAPACPPAASRRRRGTRAAGRNSRRAPRCAGRRPRPSPAARRRRRGRRCPSSARSARRSRRPARPPRPARRLGVGGGGGAEAAVAPSASGIPFSITEIAFGSMPHAT